MLRRVAALTLLLVTAALLETTVFSALAVAGHSPSLVALTVVGTSAWPVMSSTARPGRCWLVQESTCVDQLL